MKSVPLNQEGKKDALSEEWSQDGGSRTCGRRFSAGRGGVCTTLVCRYVRLVHSRLHFFFNVEQGQKGHYMQCPA